MSVIAGPEQAADGKDGRRRVPRPLGALVGWAGRTFDELGPAVMGYGAVKLIGFTVFMRLLEVSGDYLKKGAFGGGKHPWDVLGSWDGAWYQQVAIHGYHPQLIYTTGGFFTAEQNSAGFFPLYPGLMRLVMECTGLGSFGAGMLVAIVGAFAAAAGIYKVTARLGGPKAGVIAALIWAVFPGSGAEWAVYSDSLFVALCAWACYCVMTHRWLTAGTLTLIAGLSRPTSAALIAAVGLAALVALVRRQDGVLRPLLAGLMAPWGLIGYLAWVGYRMGNLSGYFILERDAWAHYFDFGRYTEHATLSVMLGRTNYIYSYPLADEIAALVLVALPLLIIALVRLKPPLVLVVYTLMTCVPALGSQQIYSNLPRYLLPAFPLFIALAIGLSRFKWTALTGMFVVLGAASGWYAGYVLFELGIP
ncbi:hypothetical protein OG455_05245 [Kitasatospora sp. NBC_01287]|uniref:hypothetical protein n=1 Tax=Kitasatospora sp. NBC_01287 TaxID=2903573 RepID=UPI0022582CC7|nr:hypothetical protein [Kitasatospora sp. NBC_01287]MCX4744932.1 hypothetical protein [Kitasatospora sp. NBC_01287]